VRVPPQGVPGGGGPRGIPGDAGRGRRRTTTLARPLQSGSLGQCFWSRVTPGRPWDAPEGKGPPGWVWGLESAGRSQQSKPPGSPCKRRSPQGLLWVRVPGALPWVGVPQGHHCKCRAPPCTPWVGGPQDPFW